MIYVIGFLAQVFFSARILLQWILSERAKKVISPAIFWQLSIVGSYLLFVYGWLRDDFAIILGQIILYLYLELGQKAPMEEITVYHPDTITSDPGGGDFIHA